MQVANLFKILTDIIFRPMSNNGGKNYKYQSTRKKWLSEIQYVS